MPLNKLRFFQNTLALSATTLIIVVWTTVSFLAYQNNLLNKKIDKVSNVKTENQKVDVETPLNWKTYSNSDLTFKYPANWILNNKDQTITSTNPEILLSPSGKTMMAQCAHLEESHVVNEMLIQKFSRVTTDDEICGGPQNPIERMFWITKEGKENSFGPGLIFYYNSPQESESEKLFNQIFSTFKFLPDTTDWKFYRNQEMGFEFKYPNNWFLIKNDDYSLKISNKNSNSAIEGAVPLDGEIILGFYYFHSALENYSEDPVETVFDNGITITNKGYYLAQSGSFGIVSTRRSEDPAATKLDKVVTQIVSTFQFSNPCSSCPLYSPPAPEWCKDGTIVAGEKDECGCQQPPTCNK